MENNDPKLCPHCGNNDTEYCVDESDRAFGFYKCNNCDARGPSILVGYNDEQVAYDAWAHRMEWNK